MPGAATASRLPSTAIQTSKNSLLGFAIGVQKSPPDKSGPLNLNGIAADVNQSSPFTTSRPTHLGFHFSRLSGGGRGRPAAPPAARNGNVPAVPPRPRVRVRFQPGARDWQTSYI